VVHIAVGRLAQNNRTRDLRPTRPPPKDHAKKTAEGGGGGVRPAYGGCRGEGRKDVRFVDSTDLVRIVGRTCSVSTWWSRWVGGKPLPFGSQALGLYGFEGDLGPTLRLNNQGGAGFSNSILLCRQTGRDGRRGPELKPEWRTLLNLSDGSVLGFWKT